MQCSNCNAPAYDNTQYCGNCGKQVTQAQEQLALPVYAQKSLQLGRSDPLWSRPGKSRFHEQAYSNTEYAAEPQLQAKTPIPSGVVRSFAPVAPSSFAAETLSPRSQSKNNPVFLGIMLTILLIGVSAGALTLFQNKHLTPGTRSTHPVPALSGQITFSSQRGNDTTDTLQITTSGLPAVSARHHYVVWIVNEQTEQIYSAGTLTTSSVQARSSYSMTLMKQGINLLALGNKLEITQESGQTTLPTGHIVLLASFPMLAFVHVKHLLVSFPTTPVNTPLLLGLISQVRQLQTQSVLLQNVSGRPTSVRCAAQSILNLVEGINGQDVQPLSTACLALHVTVDNDGFGLSGQSGSGYVAMVAMHASLAATQPDTTDIIRTHAQQIIATTDNLKGWLTTIEQDAKAIIAKPTDKTKIAEIVTLTGYTLNGANQNGKKLPGAEAAYTDGQQMATLKLVPWK